MGDLPADASTRAGGDAVWVAEVDMAQRMVANQSLFAVLRFTEPAFIGVLQLRLGNGRIFCNYRGPALSGQ
ncbi:MAG: hypothetical protein PVI69_11630 [Desulfobacterales bacterium]